MSSTGKLSKSTRQPVRSHGRIPVEQTNHPFRILTEDIAGSRDCIAADVIEATAADLGLVANIIRVGEMIREERVDRSDVAKGETPEGRYPGDLECARLEGSPRQARRLWSRS
jgi:hypothetical protein